MRIFHVKMATSEGEEGEEGKGVGGVYISDGKKIPTAHQCAAA